MRVFKLRFNGAEKEQLPHLKTSWDIIGANGSFIEDLGLEFSSTGEVSLWTESSETRASSFESITFNSWSRVRNIRDKWADFMFGSHMISQFISCDKDLLTGWKFKIVSGFLKPTMMKLLYILVCECYGSRRGKKVWASNLVGNSSCFQMWSLWLHFLTQQIDEETQGKASHTWWSNVFTWSLWLQNHYQYFDQTHAGIHMKKTPPNTHSQAAIISLR